MDLVHEKSPLAVLGELDLFTNVPVQNTLTEILTSEVRPLAQLNTGGHIDFIVINSINEYVRLYETSLYVKFNVKLSKTSNATITADDWKKVAPVNNFLNSLWKQIDLTIGSSQTSTSLQTYPYKSYISNLLFTSPQARKTWAKCELYDTDDMSADKVDKPQPDRYKIINPKVATGAQNVGKEVELEGLIHIDLFGQPKLLLGGTTFKLSLVPNNPEFYFMTEDSTLIPSIEFQEIVLKINKCIVNKEVVEAHENALTMSPAKYYMNRTEVRSFTIDSGATSRNIENVINGRLPRRVFVAFVKNDAFTGSYSKNPYKFENLNINSITCFVNGESIPRRAYTPDFRNKKVVREYLEFLKIAMQLNNSIKTDITLDNFVDGYTMFGFNLSNDGSQGYFDLGYVNFPREGNLRFEIIFGEQLTSIVNAIIYCQYDNQVSILNDRSVLMDYR